MKKFIVLLLIFALCFSMAACSGGSLLNNLDTQKVSYGVSDFEQLLTTMPLFVKSVKYLVQDEEHKALYPDMLQAIIQNNSSSDIKNAVIAFVAWDANNLPVKIKSSFDFSDGFYVREVNYNDINLVSGGSFGESGGFEIDESCNIKTFKAIVVSCESFDGTTWQNPYYDEWCKLYKGVKFDESLTVNVKVENETSAIGHTNVTPEEATTSPVTEDSLLAQIEAQELKVVKTEYLVQDEEYKSLYPDMLQAVIQNDTSYDIKNAVVAFVAWDANNLPVKIKGSIDFSDGSYIRKVNYNDINLIPGKSFGESSGFEIDEACGIKTFKAIVVSYETFDGTTWENPLYDDWCSLYEGVKLP